MPPSDLGPFVNVIIPTLNRHATVVAAIRSALAQTYRSLGVWVVDDGSDPPLRLPGDLTAHERVHLLRTQTTLGPSEARNLAVSRCDGPLIAFLDDDDRWLPDKTRLQVSALSRQGPDVAGVQCGYEMRDGDRPVFRLLPRTDRDLRLALLERTVMAPSTVLLRRDAFEGAGGFDPGLRRNQDWDLWVRLADRFRFLAMPAVLVLRGWHPPVPAEELLRNQRQMRARLERRIAALPRDERRRVEAHHEFMIGSYLAAAGRGREARERFWSAWVRQPGRLRAGLGLVRTMIGERAWRVATSAARTAWRPGRRSSRRVPEWRF